MRLHCFTCGKSVSTEVPDDTVVRGVITCPECIEGKGGAHHICTDRIDARITIIERQTTDVLRFDLMGKDGQVVRSVEAAWAEIRGLGDRNRLMGRLLWHSPQQERDRLTKENAALKRDAEKVLEGFVVGVFVRDTARDSDPGWAMKLLPYIEAMARLQHSLTLLAQEAEEPPDTSSPAPQD